MFPGDFVLHSRLPSHEGHLLRSRCVCAAVRGCIRVEIGIRHLSLTLRRVNNGIVLMQLSRVEVKVGLGAAAPRR